MAKAEPSTCCAVGLGCIEMSAFGLCSVDTCG